MGAKYGHGSYFARDAAYSLGYATSNACVLFEFEVITGVTMQGRADLKQLPVGVHSAVDRTSSPGMYVTFRDDVAYPTYVVLFEH